MDQREVNKKVVEQFREGGEIEGMHRDRLLLLTTIGAKSGEEQVTPMMFVRNHEDEVYVVASNNGAQRDPIWYRNLLQDASVGIEVGDETYKGLASTLKGAARTSAWESILKVAPFFAEHQKQANREIPVVALTRVDDN
ncbi:MAG TPA: nitroreductase/quinone reductase family protein [Galbitalea sp.]|jgi:deazaflavin-dependent oxidoreductase (nitroreductase family)